MLWFYTVTVTKGQRTVHIAAEAVGVLASPIAVYVGARMPNRSAGTFIAVGAAAMFFVDLALLANWGYQWRKGRKAATT